MRYLGLLLAASVTCNAPVLAMDSREHLIVSLQEDFKDEITLTQYIAASHHPKTLEFDFITPESHRPRRQLLSNFWNVIGPVFGGEVAPEEDRYPILTALSNVTTIEKVKVEDTVACHGNEFDKDLYDRFMKALANNNSIKELSLTRPLNFDSNFVGIKLLSQPFGQYLKEVVANKINLTYLHVRFCVQAKIYDKTDLTGFFNALSQLSNLKTLKFDYMILNDIEFLEWSSFRQNAPHLVINLHECIYINDKRETFQL